MAQIKSNWTAPTFSFDAADQPNAWIDFYYRAQDYLEVLRIKPAEEDKEKRGWEQITQMFTGENRQILQNLVDNNTITETHQRTPILALKAIETAIKNKEHHRTSTTTTRTNSATTTTKNSTKCPWKQFYKRIIKYMDSLHEEPLEPQMKIDTFVSAIRNTFPIESSTKQTQTSEQPQTQTTEQLSSSTPNSDTDSVYSTESDSNDEAHLPRPSYTPKPTKNNSTTSHLSTTMHQPKPNTSTRSDTQITVKRPTSPAPRASTASTYPRHTRKALLPTPPAPVRNFNYKNHYKQHIPTFTRPSPFYKTYPTTPRPANYRYYPQQHSSGPFFTRPYQQTPLLPIPAPTGPYQQISGHFQQVYYVPIILPQLLQHYTG